MWFGISMEDSDLIIAYTGCTCAHIGCFISQLSARRTQEESPQRIPPLIVYSSSIGNDSSEIDPVDPQFE